MTNFVGKNIILKIKNKEIEASETVEASGRKGYVIFFEFIG